METLPGKLLPKWMQLNKVVFKIKYENLLARH